LKNNCKKDEKHIYIFQDLGNYAFTERDNNKPPQQPMKTYTHKLTNETLQPVKNIMIQTDTGLLSGVEFKNTTTGKKRILTNHQIHRLLK